MNAKKRKGSCTFRRENSLRADSLDKQERIYLLLSRLRDEAGAGFSSPAPKVPHTKGHGHNHDP
jgi:hypothetical protein